MVGGEKKSHVQPPFPIFKRFPGPIERTAYRVYNYADNSLYPVRPLVFGAGVAAFAAFYTRNPDSRVLNLVPKVGQGIATQYGRIGLASVVSAYTPVFLTRFILRHFYFKYKRWLFENPKKPSFFTKLWGILNRTLSFLPPRLKSCDALLPCPAVPALEQTVERYLESIRQLHSAEELKAIEELSKAFANDEGRKLQRYARLMSLFVDNYVTGFWESFAYLYNRESLMISSSVAHVDLFEDSPATQAVRAAHIVYIEVLSHLAIDRQTYKPLGNGLLCARHYDKMYSVTRVPSENIDRLVNYGISRHICVFFNGGVYKVDIADSRGRMYTVDELTDIFNELVTREGTKVEGVPGLFPALTHDKRADWAKNRKRFFEDIPKNKKTLQIIESSAFVVFLTDNDDWGYDRENADVLSKFMSETLTGNGANRWVDKSLNYIVGKNSRCGGTTEHSIADGSEFDHIFEHFHWMDTKIIEYPPLEEQVKRAKELNVESIVNGGVKLAERLPIEVSNEMEGEISRVFNAYSSTASDVDLSSLIFRDWGKGRIKECGVSPDAFVQMAIQLANYKDQGKFALTYEAASARFYRNSRTETLRTVTDESCDFVRAMMDGKKDRATCASLLKTATELHTMHNKECMVNKGVDRHLFVLYVLSRATNTSSPFLDHYIQQQWLLSTSHIPNVTNTMKEDAMVDKSWLGACFGAVAKNGYGVCYRFAGNHSICAHISSFHSASNTDSGRFRQHLVESFNELSALFD